VPDDGAVSAGVLLVAVLTLIGFVVGAIGWLRMRRW
jgi:hypothetical protein